MKNKKLLFLPLLLCAALLAGCARQTSDLNNSSANTNSGSASAGFSYAKGETYDTGNFTGICPEGWKYVPATDVFNDNVADPDGAGLYKGMTEESDAFRCASVNIRRNDKNTRFLDGRSIYENVEDMELVIDGKTWTGFTGDHGSYKNFSFIFEDETCIWQISGLLNGSKSTFELTDNDFETILASLKDYGEASAAASKPTTRTPVTPTPAATPEPTTAPGTSESSIDVLHPEAPEGDGTTIPETGESSIDVLHPEAPESGGSTIPETAPHEHSLTAYYNVDATCTADGHWTYYVCSTCGAVLDYQYNPTTIAAEVIPAKGHDWVRVEGGDPGDCQHQGKKFYECSRCGEPYIEYLGYGPHAPGSWTDFSYDEHCRICYLCGEYLYDTLTGHYYDTILASNHDHHVRQCRDCGRVEDEAHVYGNPLQMYCVPTPGNESATHTARCYVCGYEETAPHVMEYGICQYCKYSP